MTEETLLRGSIAPVRAVDPWARLSRATGIVGLATLVLVFTPIVAISTLGEPSFTATTEEAHAFLVNASASWARLATAGLTVAAIGLVWFVVGLSLLFARAEGSPPWRSAGALVAGVLLPAHLLLDASWGAAAYRGSETEPGLARYAFDVGNLGFANAWVAMGSFAVACGWVVLLTRVFGRWLGWWAVVAGVGLVFARFAWTSEFWIAPYFLFWIWVIVVSVQLLRGRVRWVVSHDRADPTTRRHRGARGSRVRGLTWVYAAGFGGPAVPVSVYLLRRGSLPWFGDQFEMYGGPWSGRLRDGQFVGLLLSYLGLTALVAWAAGRVRQARGAGPWSAPGCCRRGRVLARIRTAHSVLGAARVALLVAAWRRLRGPQPGMV